MGLISWIVVELRFGDESQPTRAVSDPSLVEDLRQGGHVIYFHYASIESGGPDGPQNFGHRQAQRNLSKEAYAEARIVGGAFRRLDIPAGEVLSKPFYRSLDTARFAFGEAEPTGALIGVPWDRSFPPHQREAAVLKLLSTRLPDGTNKVLVSETSSAEEFARISLAEGLCPVWAALRVWRRPAAVPARSWSANHRR